MTPGLGQRVIAVARSLIGSHYINGAYGATPGRSDGCPCRADMVGLIADEKHLNTKLNAGNKESNLAVNAATTNINRYAVCAGNYSTAGGGPVGETAPDLVAYLDSLKGKPPASWQSNDAGMTPRRAFGPGATGGEIGGTLVWGKSCVGVRHFDCVGFISYCYWKASGVVVQLDIGKWRDPKAGVSKQVFNLRQIGDDPANPPAALMDGDILIQMDHHIGYVTATGSLIQAEDTHIGVRETPGFSLATPGKWTHLVRVGGGGSEELDWPSGWWRVWDGNHWYYYLDPSGIIMSTKTAPFNTRTRPPKAHNTGTWVRTGPNTLIVTWKQVAGAPKPCVETFYNASEGCEQMNANSNLYSPLVATRMI